MKVHWGFWVYGLVMAGIVSLIFFLPEAMTSPGHLMPAHADLSGSCASCHAPFQGAVASRCMDCHTPATIGIKTSAGVPIVPVSRKAAFHQSLTTQDCMACHTDHKGLTPASELKPSFSHALLRPDVASQCATCHTAPKTAMHANFKGQCSTCHTQAAWKPATFDHARYFDLSGPHNVPCASCHVVANDFSQYNCTTCHEHNPARIAAQHREEGITNTANCVSCHRSASGEGHGDFERGEGRDED
jgi:hypothetical protein